VDYRNVIESVVETTKEKGSDLLCTACEMAVVWMENQLRENATKDRILTYANQVLKIIVFVLSGLIQYHGVCCNLVGKILWQVFFFSIYTLNKHIIYTGVFGSCKE
jgi:tetrahydromethanopterin S-methyltransferase subunit C